MKIMDSIRNFFIGGQENREVYELNKDDQEILKMLGIEVGEVNVRGLNALKIDTVFACIRIRSEAVSKLPLKVYQEDDHGIQIGAKHYLQPMLKIRPNPYMSASDFWKSIEAHRSMGNAYASIEFDKRTGKVKALWPMDPAKVKVMVDDLGLVGPRSKLWYEVEVAPGEIRKLNPEEVLHFKGSITLDGLVGIPTLDYLKMTLENAAAANKFTNNFFKQGLQVKGLIQYVGDLDEPAKKKFREKFEEMSSGLKNSHRVALMPVGFQFTPLSLKMADAQFLENTQLTIRQIANGFGVKMHQLNDLSRATHTNIESQQREFYVDSLQPVLTGYEQEMTWKLFLDSELERGYYCRFNVDAILRADIKTRYEAYRVGIQAGFLKPNEARAKEELPPEAGGDQLLVNGSMTPIAMAGAAYQNKLKGGDGNGQKKSDEDQGNEGSTGQTGDQGDNGGK
ncbi:phage portal protein [Cytobacillus oceanisediminis]|uniref:phage portal protein n=1 Tax=Cytobacillus oceanisediminis TaxID=665099 RepID=UPI001C23DFD6|nr:phage portal protein [Cytobacillus oceanisediminis]MBU8733443.1 phage portal protein [Cytobacillus oceanisediminis]